MSRLLLGIACGATALMVGCLGGRESARRAYSPTPVVVSFSASPASVAYGAASILTPVFSGGNAVVDHGIGVVASGKPFTTGVLTATKTYTLTVSSVLGEQAVATATVIVGSPPQPAVPSADLVQAIGQVQRAGMTSNTAIVGEQIPVVVSTGTGEVVRSGFDPH